MRIFAKASTHQADPFAKTGAALTPMESRVGFWLAEGKTNWEIGVIVGCATRTVEKHIERILSKLHVENRTAAARAITATRLNAARESASTG